MHCLTREIDLQLSSDLTPIRHSQAGSIDVGLTWVQAFPNGALNMRHRTCEPHAMCVHAMHRKCMPQNRPALQTRPVRHTDGSTHCYCWHHAEGSILPDQTQVVSLEYDPSQLPQQGRYDTNVLVQMSEQPYAKVSTPLLPHRRASVWPAS